MIAYYQYQVHHNDGRKTIEIELQRPYMNLYMYQKYKTIRFSLQGIWKPKPRNKLVIDNLILLNPQNIGDKFLVEYGDRDFKEVEYGLFKYKGSQ